MPPAGFVAENWATPTRSARGDEPSVPGSPCRWQDPPATATAAQLLANNKRERPTSMSHFLFIGGSSTQLPQIPVGFMLVPFLTILIFIVIS